MRRRYAPVGVIEKLVGEAKTITGAWSFTTSLALDDNVPLYFGSDNDVALSWTGSLLNFQGDITGGFTTQWVNDLVGTSDHSRLVVTNGAANSLAIWSANANNTATLITGDISGARHIIRALGDHPIQFGVNQLKVGAFTSTGLEIWEPGSTTDKVLMSHDGTDFNADFTNTTDWNLGGGIGLVVEDTAGTSGLRFHQSTTDSRIIPHGSAATLKLLSWSALQLQDGAKFRIYNSADTDYAEMYHDGTDFNNAYTNTTDVNNTGADNYKFDDTTIVHSTVGGNLLQIHDSGGTGSASVAYLSFYDDTPTRLAYIGMASGGDNDLYIVNSNTTNGDINITAGTSSSYRFGNSTSMQYNGNNVLTGDTTAGKTIVRSMQFDCRPGATPGTNINIVGQNFGNEGFNEPSSTNATNLAASGTSGSWTLDASALGLMLDLTESIVHVGASCIEIGDANGSAARPVYVRAITNGNNVSYYLYTDGTSGAIAWTSMLKSGDVIYFNSTIITNA